MIETQETERHSHNPLVRYFKLLGPGLVTGASDDDPSGITTYSVAGATLVGVLGTTISPYLFFWQASQEVEEEKARGRRTAAQRRGAAPPQPAHRPPRGDTGHVFSNNVEAFIIPPTAGALNPPGVTQTPAPRPAPAAPPPP